MANADPTAANIIASLGIRGAAKAGGAAAAGCVPVLNSSGKIPASFLDLDGIVAEISNVPLSKVAFVDGSASVETRNGSITNPYAKLSDAAGAGFPTIVLAGANPQETISFSGLSNGDVVRIIGVGAASIANGTVINGLGAGERTVVFKDVSAQTLTISSTSTVKVVCEGDTSIATLVGNGNDDTNCISELLLDNTARVSSTAVENISYRDEASRIENNSNVPGKTAADALNRLNLRKVRVLKLSEGSDGNIEYDSYEDISATSGDAGDVYDLRRMMEILVDAINRANGSDSGYEFENLDVRDTLTADTVKTNNFQLGGCIVRVDEAGYLVAGTGADPEPQESSSAVPEGIYLEDVASSCSGTIYKLFVEDGRLAIDLADVPEYEAAERIVLSDVMGAVWEIEILNGEIVLSSTGSYAERHPQMLSNAYVLDPETHEFHKMVAVSEGGYETLALDQDPYSG